jgi:hypothetical protein
LLEYDESSAGRCKRIAAPSSIFAPRGTATGAALFSWNNWLPGGGTGDYLDRCFVALLAAIAVVHLCLFGYYLRATAIREPFSDMLNYISDFLRYRQTGDLGYYLWMPHTQHRLIWTRLITAFDIDAFQGVAYPFLVVATTSLILVPVLIRHEVNRAGLSQVPTFAVGWLIVMLVLTTANVVDCSIPIEDIYPHTLVFAVLSLILFDGRGESANSTHLRRVAALLAAVGAAFSSATGLVLWPVLLWVTWRGRAGWTWAATVACVGTTFVVLYTRGMPIPLSTSSALRGDAQFYAQAHLLKIGDYLLTYMGLPWTRASALAVVGRLIGAILLVVGVASIVRRGVLRPPASRLERIAISLIMFSLATAALAAIGRVDERADVEVPVRYSVYLAPLHVGLLCLVLPWVSGRWRVLNHRRISQVTVLTVASLLLVQQVAAGRAAAATTQTITATIDRFIGGKRDPQMTRFVSSDLNYADQVFDMMKREGIYIGRRRPER